MSLCSCVYSRCFLAVLATLMACGHHGTEAGKLWPKPQSQTFSTNVLQLNPKHFKFRTRAYTSNTLEKAYKRYAALMFDKPDYKESGKSTFSKKHHTHNSIEYLDVYVYSFDQSLNLDTDESYTLTVEAPVSVLQCHTVYGALRGLETLSQLLDRVPEDEVANPRPIPARAAPIAKFLTPWQALAVAIRSCWRSFMQLVSMTHPAATHTQHTHEDGRFETESIQLLHKSAEEKSAEAELSHDSLNTFSADLAYDTPTAASTLQSVLLSSLAQTGQDAGKLDGVEDSSLYQHKDHKQQHNKPNKKHHNKKHHKKHRRARLRYVTNATAISDAPRFRHRGLLLDTSRHFLPVQNIKDHLDAMTWAKMNVFHWHLVDDPSFPLQTHQLPQLSRQGAFSQRHVYTHRDVADIIAYAKDRGIRVIPELDTPGHTASWGRGYPELLTQCYDEQGMPNGQLGPLNPTRNSTYNALWLLLRETAQVFPDSYLHLGGDEVPFDCWQSNPEVQDWMRANSLDSLSQLETYFENRVLDLATLAGRSYIVWQDVLDNNVTLKPDTVVHVWKWWPVTTARASAGASARSQVRGHTAHAVHALPTDPTTGHTVPAHSSLQSESHLGMNGSHISHEDLTQHHSSQQFSQQPSQQSSQQSSQQQSSRQVSQHGSPGPVGCQLSRGCPGDIGSSLGAGEQPGWFPEMEKVTAQGFQALLSSPWYINLGRYAGDDWAEYYAVEPLAFKGTRRQHDLVMGGEACMWGEFVDATNSMSATWPRAAAVAERLWSDQSVRDRHDAEERLHEHRCRMLARGLPAQPLGPGFCPQDLDF